jgi:hypothetical protein
VTPAATRSHPATNKPLRLVLGTTDVARLLCRSASILLVVLFAWPCWAASPSPTETAIGASDPDALKQALHGNPPPLAGSDDSPLLAAIEVLANAPSDRKERARDVIRVLIAAGAPVDRAFEVPSQGAVGTPVTWVGRIPGERDFLLELMSRVEPDKRCGVIADMIQDGNPGQWDNALSSIAAVPSDRRGSHSCGNLFMLATRAADPPEATIRVNALFSAGLSPTLDAAASVLARLSDGDGARRAIARIIAADDVDRPLARPTDFDGGVRPDSLFAVLLHATLVRSGGALQANLAAMPEWPPILKEHQANPAACDSNMVDAADESWSNLNLDGNDTDATSPKRDLLRAGTQWLLARCDPSLMKNLAGWADMIKAGSGDLVVLAADRGVPFEDREPLVNVALCAGDDRLFERLMRDVNAKQSLDDFMACLAPPETPVKSGGDIDILRWLLAHGADARTLVDGASPRAIAAFFDRDDVVATLREAGAEPARLTGDVRDVWLRRRLDEVAGFDPPSLPFEKKSDDEDANPGRGLMPVDLDADGRPEFITGDGYCGNVNCQFAVAAYQGRRWHIVLSDAGDTTLLSTRHHGWRDISVSGRASAAEYDTTIYHYDGHSYRAAICEQTVYDENNDTPQDSRHPC